MRTAAFTFVQDDDPFIPVWERYYREQFDTIDRVQYEGEFAPDKALSMIKNKFAELLQSHDVVMFSDLDEMVIPNPQKYSGLRDYIEKRGEFVFAQCHGFDVVQQADEPPLDLSKPIIPQRRAMAPASMYCKPLITTRVLDWSVGLHYVQPTNNPSLTDRDLILFHLLYADRELAGLRIRNRREITDEELDARFAVDVIPIPAHFRS